MASVVPEETVQNARKLATPPPERSDRDRIFQSLLVLQSSLLFGSAVLGRLEFWSVVDALYFAVVTTTTVGYGDVTPKRVSSRLITCIFVLICIAAVAAALQNLQRTILERHHGRLVKYLDTVCANHVANVVAIDVINHRKIEITFLQISGRLLWQFWRPQSLYLRQPPYLQAWRTGTMATLCTLQQLH